MVSDVSLSAEAIRERLGLGEGCMPWLEELAALELAEPAVLPAPAEAAPSLARLRVPAGQAVEAITAMPSLERTPELWWVMERCSALLIREMGKYAPLRPWPDLPRELGTSARYCYVWAFLATLPAVRRWHAQRGIPDDVSWATLADLGRHMAIHERMSGEGGLSTQNWMTLHFRAAIYDLGRLQFNRSRVRQDAATIEAAGGRFQQGDPSLGVHIPESGPLTPEACDASFLRARDFFATYFPEERPSIAICNSWLLDDQLAAYLPPTSNIVRFQRRFHMLPGGHPADDSVIHFVFRMKPASLDDLPQRTTLERAVVSHLRAGKHWQSRAGWVAL